MAKDRPIISEPGTDTYYRITWWLADDQDLGATLGEGEDEDRFDDAALKAAPGQPW